MKYAILTASLALLAACSDDPTMNLYRYGAGTEPAITAYPVASLFTGRGQVVDYHNHGLDEPGKGQSWYLVPGAFLLLDAGKRIVRTVPARMSGL